MIITKEVMKRGKLVPVSSLSKSSNFRVDVQCPSCNEIRNVMYSGICRSGHTVCQKCSVAVKCAKVLPIGTKYNMLTVIKRTTSGYSKCSCDCGNYTEVRNYALTSGSTKSCGCLIQQNKYPVFFAESHPNWKGGISGDRDRFMSTAIYKSWRLDVFERDEFTCQRCSQIGGKLEAHHIIPYSVNEELRVVVDNGITFCLACHNEFHKLYGRIECNHENIESFTNKLGVRYAPIH